MRCCIESGLWTRIENSTWAAGTFQQILHMSTPYLCHTTLKVKMLVNPFKQARLSSFGFTTWQPHSKQRPFSYALWLTRYTQQLSQCTTCLLDSRWDAAQKRNHQRYPISDYLCCQGDFSIASWSISFRGKPRDESRRERRLARVRICCSGLSVWHGWLTMLWKEAKCRASSQVICRKISKTPA